MYEEEAILYYASLKVAVAVLTNLAVAMFFAISVTTHIGGLLTTAMLCIMSVSIAIQFERQIYYGEHS